MFSDHGLCGLLEEGAHGKSPKCLGGNLGDFGEFCKGLRLAECKKPAWTQAGFVFGRNERIRTSDPFVPNEVRYRAALHSECGKL